MANKGAEDDEAAEGKLDADEVMDIITNYLACESSLAHSSMEEIKELQESYCAGAGFEKTYEFFFNLSQVHLKDARNEEALALLKQAYDKASADGSLADD